MAIASTIAKRFLILRSGKKWIPCTRSLTGISISPQRGRTSADSADPPVPTYLSTERRLSPHDFRVSPRDRGPACISNRERVQELWPARPTRTTERFDLSIMCPGSHFATPGGPRAAQRRPGSLAEMRQQEHAGQFT
jgi:hypothetical protein